MKKEQSGKGDYLIDPKTGSQIYNDKEKPADPKESRLLELITGAEPINDDEREMLKEIEKTKAAGQIVDIPFI